MNMGGKAAPIEMLGYPVVLPLLRRADSRFESELSSAATDNFLCDVGASRVRAVHADAGGTDWFEVQGGRR